MTIRDATPQDRERLRELYQDFVREIPPLPGIPLDIEHELAELEEYLGDEKIALVAEDDGGQILGFALANLEDPGIGHLSDIYVAPEARRQGAARDLIREAAMRLLGDGASVLVEARHADTREALAKAKFQALGSVPADPQPFALSFPTGGLVEVRVTLRTAERLGAPRIALVGVEWHCPGPD